MKHVPLATLQDKIVRPGFEKHLTTLLAYRGSLDLGRIHRLWNLMVSALEHEATASDITQRLSMNPEYSQLCGPEGKISHMGLRSFIGRLEDNPKVMAELPGLAEYVRWVLPPYKRGFRLGRISEITHRSRNMGAGGWRTFVDDRTSEPLPEDFRRKAKGKSIRWARQEYQCSYYAARKWFAEAHLEPDHGNLKAVPENWRVFADRESNLALARRYGVSTGVIARWRLETGIARPIIRATLTTAGRAPMAYPFLIHEGRSQEHALLRRVNAAVPSYLEPDLRADICQDLIVGILSGEFPEDDLALPAKAMVKRVQKMFPTKYGPLSLDAEIPGTDGFRLIDTLSEEDSIWNRI